MHGARMSLFTQFCHPAWSFRGKSWPASHNGFCWFMNTMVFQNIRQGREYGKVERRFALSGLLQSVIFSQEAPERAKRLSTFPYSRPCLMFETSFFLFGYHGVMGTTPLRNWQEMAVTVHLLSVTLFLCYLFPSSSRLIFACQRSQWAVLHFNRMSICIASRHRQGFAFPLEF